MKKHNLARYLALITQVGISMMAPIFLCIAIGVVLRHFFQVNLILLFLVLGILAGGRNTYILIMDQIKKEEKERKNHGKD